MKRASSAIILVLALSIACLAAPKLEKLPAFSGDAPEKIKAALQPEGHRVYLPNTLAACEIWLAAKVPVEKNPTQGANYPEFNESTFLGVITFPKGGGTDFRGQSIRAGTYTMRYEAIPTDGNHMGVAPNPDFVLLIPIADDPDPAAKFDFGKMVELSMSASRTAHPASFEMMPPEGDAPAVTQTDDGWIVFHGNIVNSAGKKVSIAIVVKGVAS